MERSSAVTEQINLQQLTINQTDRKSTNKNALSDGEIASIIYHDIFDYPLTLGELIKWSSDRQQTVTSNQQTVSFKNGFYFLEGKSGIVYKRLLKRRISARKLEIARKAARVLGFLPTVKVVGVTGALAMENASFESDIDLMVIASKGSLWTTRIISYVVLWFYGQKIRTPQRKNERDKLCLNMWLDESDLIFRKRNIYTAHEIAQIVPLVNKDKTYERFIAKNLWIRKYWPNSIRNKNLKIKDQKYKSKRVTSFAVKNFYFFIFNVCFSVVEIIAFKLQYFYMKNKITREIVTPTRALFHPVDWGEVILKRLGLDNKKSSY